MSGDAGGNRVVLNLSSTAGITCIGDMFATPAYTASKHAVTAMTRAFGVQTYPTNIGITRSTPTATPLVVISDGVKIWLL